MAYRSHDEKIEVGSGTPTNDGKLTPSLYLDISSGTLYYRQLGSAGWSAVGATASGAPTLYRSQAINYNSANLRTGITIYTPAVNDVLVDAWIQIDTAFDGTTPQADLAQWTLLANGSPGWFGSYGNGAVGVSGSDAAEAGDQFFGNTSNSANTDLMVAPVSVNNNAYRGTPGYLASADPIQVIVTQDGLKNGAAIGGTAGSLIVYLVIAKAVQL